MDQGSQGWTSCGPFGSSRPKFESFLSVDLSLHGSLDSRRTRSSSLGSRSASIASSSTEEEDSRDIPEEGRNVLVEVEEGGLYKEININCGRFNSNGSSTMLRLEPTDKPNLFTIRFCSTHHAFSVSSSSTVRSAACFFFLQRRLKVLHQYVPVPILPPRPIFWALSQQKKIEKLATFLAQVLEERQYLGNKALHLFLQSSLSTEIIAENLEGRRDDDLPNSALTEKRRRYKDGLKFKKTDPRKTSFLLKE